jgi:hypothetical protein
MTDDAWQPIETAPRGGGAEKITDPNWFEPPDLLLLFPNGKQAVACWDWYYAEGGAGYTHDASAWVEQVSGEQVALHYSEPTYWMPLPDPPESEANNEL